VDYAAVLDVAIDPTGSIADAEAKTHYDSVDQILLRFGCSTTYSMYTCSDCRDAYKYWVCAAKFQKCGGIAHNITATCPPWNPRNAINDMASSTCDLVTRARARLRYERSPRLTVWFGCRCVYLCVKMS
ncbi:hypothetical protein AaE_004468, partial [Aphanomyces astaci]